MAERDTAPPSKLRKLSVVVPVYNERNTLVEIVRRMRAVELPDSIEREIIVVDDGSDDGTRDVLQPARRQHGARRAARAQPRQGCGGAHRVRARDRRLRPRAGRRSRVRPRRLAAAARAGARGQGAGRVRLALHRRAPQHALPPLGRQPVPVARHERALQHDALRHGDVLQADRPCAARPDASSRPTASTSSPRSPPRSSSAACASTRCRSRTRVARSTRARRSPGATASRALWTLVKYRVARLTARAAMAAGDPRGPRSIVNYEAGPLLDGVCGRCSPTRARVRSSSSSSTTARATVRSRRWQRALPATCRSCARRATSATRAARTSASRRPARRSSRCLNPDTDVEPGTAGALLARLDTQPPARGASDRASRTSTAPTIRRRGSCRRRPSR